MSTDATTQRSTRAARAMAHLPEVDPALAALALWCETRDGLEVQTRTTSDVIVIGTGFDALPLHEQIGVLAHHILHVALRHEVHLQVMQLRFGKQHDLALHNLCADAIVNECLFRGGHALPRPAVLLRELLPEETGAQDDILNTWGLDRLYLRCATAAPAEVEQIMAYATDKGFEPDIPLGHPDPLAPQRAAEWRAHLIRAYQAGGAAGRGIGSALRHLADTGQSRTPWEQQLRGLLAKATQHSPRPSYRRPRSTWIAREAEALRKKGPQPVFEPAFARNDLRPRVVVGIDTSGSVSSEILSLFAGEVVGITKKSNAETHVLLFDELVYAHRQITQYKPNSAFEGLSFRRDGGTSFEELMQQAEALNPSIIIVLTDTLGHFGAAPAAKVVWASPAPVPRLPPYGQVLELIR